MSSTTQQISVVFADSGLDAMFAMLVMVSVFLGAWLFIYSYKLGLSFFEK